MPSHSGKEAAYSHSDIHAVLSLVSFTSLKALPLTPTEAKIYAQSPFTQPRTTAVGGDVSEHRTQQNVC